MHHFERPTSLLRKCLRRAHATFRVRLRTGAGSRTLPYFERGVTIAGIIVTGKSLLGGWTLPHARWGIQSFRGAGIGITRDRSGRMSLSRSLRRGLDSRGPGFRGVGSRFCRSWSRLNNFANLVLLWLQREGPSILELIKEPHGDGMCVKNVLYEPKK
jgi:hypothetical protein